MLGSHFVVTRADQQPQFRVEVPVRLADRTLVIHGLQGTGVNCRHMPNQTQTRTKYSDVLPDGSFTPPPYIVVDVLCTCDGVLVRVLAPVDAPDLRMIVPLSQPLRCAILQKKYQTVKAPALRMSDTQRRVYARMVVGIVRHMATLVSAEGSC